MIYKEIAIARVRVAPLDNSGRVAVIQQSAAGGPLWLLPGGGVEVGETLEQAAIREVAEETGLAIKNLAIIAVRETLIVGYLRTYEFFFTARASGRLRPGLDPERIQQVITGAKWIQLIQLSDSGVLPSFVAELLDHGSFRYFTEVLNISEYIQRYGDLPSTLPERELVYVMLKPDALEHGLTDKLVDEFRSFGAELVAQVYRTLTQEQLEIVYFDFSHEPARQLVFDYLTSRPTLHLAFVGLPGLHRVMNEAKGRTGSGEGLRGRYITWYTPLSAVDRELWLQGVHPKQSQIDLEMFCCNLLHVAPDAEASIRSIECILSSN